MSATVLQLKPYDNLDRHDGLASSVPELTAAYRDASAEDVLRAVLIDNVVGDIALVSSFGAESVVLLHLAAQIRDDVPVIFLETGKHFAQTISYRRKLINRLGLTNNIEVKPTQSALEQADPDGGLWRRDTNACCNMRKVHPLRHELAGYDAWITGRKQFQGGARLRLPFFEEAATHIKVNPLARWSPEDVAAYMTEHDLPQHPLVAHGFPSIGCWPCTYPVADDEDARAGRWRGQAKTECGIHL
ncbi:phosphoadenylyl-sulfate reductase [Parvularcula sp. IMCC14364]|uniref:phosphoadenylyl-sulfate reductase n=1 Tax=Parvularcula sp. IMCC14364 TaxID=3067902 RepID=UPI002740A6D3|nr:phosphoadenylyl-sulfate reductase [Parvularcula sp. IMCC14364]